MAAAPLPAARQITRPFGTGRRCGASTTSGWAAATAASKIARSRGRRSVIGVRDLMKTCDARYPSDCGKRKPPEHVPRGSCEERHLVPDAVQRSLRCTAEPGPTLSSKVWTPDQQRTTQQAVA